VNVKFTTVACRHAVVYH